MNHFNFQFSACTVADANVCLLDFFFLLFNSSFARIYLYAVETEFSVHSISRFLCAYYFNFISFRFVAGGVIVIVVVTNVLNV